MTEVKNIISQFVSEKGSERSGLLPLLELIVEKQAYLSPEALLQVSAALHISPADVYGTAGFYSHLPLSPVGRYCIRVCRNVSCMMNEKTDVLKILTGLLGIEPGGTTSDKRFTLLSSNCIGCCNQTPAMMINKQVYSALTEEKIKVVINEYRQKD